MIPEITLISSGKGIINNWSLHYIEKQKEITYTTSHYSFTKHFIYYVIVTPIILFLLEQSIKAYNNETEDKDKVVCLLILFIILSTANAIPNNQYNGISLIDGIYGKPLIKDKIEKIFETVFYGRKEGKYEHEI